MQAIGRIACLGVAMVLLTSGCGSNRATESQASLGNADLAAFDDPQSLASWKEPGSWPQHRHDPMHSGRTAVDLGTKDLELAWKFQPSVHARTYQRQYTTWSSPIAGTVNGRPLVFLGAYDHNLYAVDARTGEEAWRFTAGAPVFATPALARVGEKSIIVVPAADRIVYALDASTGEKIWAYETREWTFTSMPSVMTSPTPIETDDGTVVYVITWNSDRAAVGNVQRSELYCFDAKDGSVKWKQGIGTTPGTCPAVAPIDGRLMVVCASEAGLVQAFDAVAGERKWKFHLDNNTKSTASIGAPAGIPMVYIGTRFNAVYGLDARTGRKNWRYQTANWVDASPALLGPRDDLRVVIGSYDFSYYALPARSAERPVRPVWRQRTGNWAHASATTARLNEKPVVLGISWDANLYLMRGDDGETLWTYRSGDLIWSHVEQGDAIWPSPTVAMADGTPQVYYAAYDGVLYAFRGRRTETDGPVAGTGAAAQEES